MKQYTVEDIGKASYKVSVLANELDRLRQLNIPDSDKEEILGMVLELTRISSALGRIEMLNS